MPLFFSFLPLGLWHVVCGGCQVVIGMLRHQKGKYCCCSRVNGCHCQILQPLHNWPPTTKTGLVQWVESHWLEVWTLSCKLGHQGEREQYSVILTSELLNWQIYYCIPRAGQRTRSPNPKYQFSFHYFLSIAINPHSLDFILGLYSLKGDFDTLTA